MNNAQSTVPITIPTIAAPIIILIIPTLGAGLYTPEKFSVNKVALYFVINSFNIIFNFFPKS